MEKNLVNIASKCIENINEFSGVSIDYETRKLLLPHVVNMPPEILRWIEIGKDQK